jgi:hypothetical protein
MTTTIDVLAEVRVERARQDAKWGEQNHPDGTGDWDAYRGAWSEGTLKEIRQGKAREAKDYCDRAAKERRLTYRHILDEEVREAFAEDDKAKLRAELLQVAAVAVAWIEKLDREASQGADTRPFGMVQPPEPWPRSP